MCIWVGLGLRVAGGGVGGSLYASSCLSVPCGLAVGVEWIATCCRCRHKSRHGPSVCLAEACLRRRQLGKYACILPTWPAWPGALPGDVQGSICHHSTCLVRTMQCVTTVCFAECMSQRQQTCQPAKLLVVLTQLKQTEFEMPIPQLAHVLCWWLVDASKQCC